MTEKKTKQTLKVAESTELSQGVYSLLLEYAEGKAPREVKPGQFVGVYPKDASKLLPRPISICGWEPEKRQLRLVYRVAGNGTREFSGWRSGDTADILGILGNGYDVSAMTGKRVLLLGGGIGAPPMLGLAKALYAANLQQGLEAEAARETVTAVMGYRTNDLFLKEDFQAVSRLVISTDDGTAGFYGNSVAAARDLIGAGEDGTRGTASFDVICSCGPLPMLRGVKALAEELGIPAFISLEERMACGIGACLGCVAKTTKKDEHSRVHNARICTEGPVFAAEDVEI